MNQYLLPTYLSPLKIVLIRCHDIPDLYPSNFRLNAVVSDMDKLFLHLPFILLLLSGIAYSIGKKKLSIAGAITGAFCGLLIYVGAGYAGFLMMTTFFLLGTLATKLGRNKKAGFEIRVESGARNHLQVLANAGMATILATLALADPSHAPLYQLLLAAAFASATADTLSSELGMLYGKNSFNCLSFKKERRGLDGVISIEGTLAGLAGAGIIALIFSWHTGFDANFLLILLSGAFGNYADSVIGATLERSRLVNNDIVNFLSTFIAVACCFLVNLL